MPVMGRKERMKALGLAALVLIIVLCLFLPICGYEFSLIDDPQNVFRNRFICHLDSQNIGYLWRHTYYDLYMPVTYTLWALLARTMPLRTPVVLLNSNDPSFINPHVFHAASLIIHLATTALIFAILRRLRFTPWACAAGALLFGAHPLQVESVAWITGMNNLVSGFFGFLAIYLYLLQARYQAEPVASKRRSAVLVSLATITFAAALLSKPIATIVPLCLLAIETLVLQRPLRFWRAPIGLWLVMSCACIWVTHAASSGLATDAWTPIWDRPFIAGDALAFYMAKLAVPYNLTFDYTRSPSAVLQHWWGYVTWILPAAVIAAVCVRWQRSGATVTGRSSLQVSLRMGLLLFVIGLLPTLGFVPYYSEVISTVSDRFLYIAMLGPAVALAGLLSTPSLRSHKLLVVLPALVIAVYCGLTALQIPIWTNMYSQTRDMLDSSPGSYLAHQSNGILLGKRQDWAGALEEFKTAQRLQSTDSADLHESRGESLYQLKQYDEAIPEFKRAIVLQPDDNDAWYELWVLLTRQKRLPEAEAFIRERIAKYPDDDRAKFTLGLVLMQENRPADALPYVELAAKSEPDSSENQYYVGVIFQKLGRFADAAAYYKKALDLDPRNADAARATASLPTQR